MKTTNLPQQYVFAFKEGAQTKRRSKRGSTLMMVMLLMLVMGMMLGSLHLGGRQRTYTLQRETGRMKALTIAEAGLGNAFSYLAEDVSRIDNDPILSNNNYSDGSYVVRASVPEGADDGVVLLTATGTYRGQTIESKATVKIESEEVSDDVGESPVLPLGPFGSAGLLAGGDFVISGGVGVNVGEEGAHANGEVKITGGIEIYAAYLSTNGDLTIRGGNTINLSGTPQVTLGGSANRLHANGAISKLVGTIETGDISSSVSITTHSTVLEENLIAPTISYPHWEVPANMSEQSVPNVDPISLPYIDIEAFKEYAVSNDTYFEGNHIMNYAWRRAEAERHTDGPVYNPNITYAPPGGVMFVDGDIKITSDTVFEGVIVATGDITLNGGATFANPTDYPAMVSVDGDIDVGGGASAPINGWIYAMNGNVKCSGGAEGFSGIIAAQDIKIVGGYAFGEDSELNEINWPGAPSGGGGEGEGAAGAGGLRLLSWIR